jgi:hypothetical protein
MKWSIPLGVLIALGVILHYYFRPNLHDMDVLNRDITLVCMNKQIRPAIKQYREIKGAFPEQRSSFKDVIYDVENTNGMRAGRLPYKDAWGREYVYRMPGSNGADSFDLISRGLDGLVSDDDIKSSESLEPK